MSLSDTIRWLVKDYCLDCCVITQAEKGVLACNAKGDIFEVQGLKVSVLDTIGAGDAFTAAFIKKYLEKSSLLECCQYGNSLGALVAQTKGGMAYISVEELNRFFYEKY